ncbi:MAG TPA: CD225/dispanin family protein [Planctomycetota bacterium]|nr:CD225/dispanin family protein [Planctomycetota bacterium]
MYCRSCLAANPEGAVKCVQCGAPLTDAIKPASESPSLELEGPPTVPTPPQPSGQTPSDPGPTMPATPPTGGGGADEFELQPEHERKDISQGPPPLTPEEEFEVRKEGKKKEKKKDEPAPEMPKNFNNQCIALIVASVLSAGGCGCLTTWCSCFYMFSLILGILALLESGKVKAFYSEEHYDDAERASADTKRYLTIGAIVFAVALLTNIVVLGVYVALHGLKIFNLFGGRGNGD